MKTKAVAWVFLCSLLLALAACALGADEGDKGGDLGEGGAEATGGGITWRREGGIAGFCDVVTITLPDEATVSSCASDPPQVREELELTAEQATRLQALIDSLASFDRETSDPGTADASGVTDLLGVVLDVSAEDAERAVAAARAGDVDLVRVGG